MEDERKKSRRGVILERRGSWRQPGREPDRRIASTLRRDPYKQGRRSGPPNLGPGARKDR